MNEQQETIEEATIRLQRETIDNLNKLADIHEKAITERDLTIEILENADLSGENFEQVDDLERALAQVNEELARITNKHKLRGDIIKGRDEKIKELNATRRAQKVINDQLTKNVTERDETIKSQEEEIAVLYEQRDALEDAIKERERANDRLEEIEHDRDAWRNALCNECQERRKEKDALNDQIMTMKVRLNDKTVLIRAIQKENEILKEHNRDYQVRVMNAETAVRERDEKIAELEQSEALDHANIDDRDETISKLEDEIERLESQDEEVEKVGDALRARVRNRDKQIETLEFARLNLLEINGRLNKQLDTAVYDDNQQLATERDNAYNEHQALIAVCMNVLNQHKEASTSLLELEQIVSEELEEEQGGMRDGRQD